MNIAESKLLPFRVRRAFSGPTHEHLHVSGGINPGIFEADLLTVHCQGHAIRYVRADEGVSVFGGAAAGVLAALFVSIFVLGAILGGWLFYAGAGSVIR